MRNEEGSFNRCRHLDIYSKFSDRRGIAAVYGVE
jgi:hypothetical protein